MESMGQKHPTDLVRSFGRQAIKQYIVYDGFDRPTEVYEALSSAENGNQCLLTEYEYDGTSSRVIKMRESLTTWVSATMDM
jgi:hypothetical protein